MTVPSNPPDQLPGLGDLTLQMIICLLTFGWGTYLICLGVYRRMCHKPNLSSWTNSSWKSISTLLPKFLGREWQVSVRTLGWLISNTFKPSPGGTDYTTTSGWEGNIFSRLRNSTNNMVRLYHELGSNAKAHLKGPIVRIKPNEVHCNDPEFVEVLFTGPLRKRDKDPWLPRAMAGEFVYALF